MSTKLAIMAGMAVVFGTTSYYAGNSYLDSAAQLRLHEIDAGNGSGVEITQIVVAVEPLRFGQSLSAENLKLVPWPKDSIPAGSFTTIESALADGERKAVASIEANEPILTIKVTGEDGRAGLAGVIGEGMRAVTIPVNTVNGVGGFVQPGDLVDIVFSQRNRRNGEQTAEIFMEKVKVLSVDQDADTRGNGPKVASSVTLETDLEGAQKLALANNVGELSLLLRGAGDETSVSSSTISLKGLLSGGSSESEDGGPSPEPNEAQRADAGPAADAADQGGIFSFLNQKEEKSVTQIQIVRGEKTLTKVVPVQKILNKTAANQE